MVSSVETVTSGVRMLRDIPYAEVAQVFRGFVSPLRTGFFGTRGGHDVKRTPHNPHHRVESSFSAEQRPYVITALGCLNVIARGIPYETAFKGTTRYSSVMEGRVANGTIPPRFSILLMMADIDLLHYFGQLHPNLLPALEAAFDVAGAEGMVAAITSSTDFLYGACSGKLNKHTIDASSNEENFFNSHDRLIVDTIGSKPYPKLKSGPYEVWCSGEALAQTLMREAKVGAIALARNPVYKEQVRVMVNQPPEVLGEMHREIIGAVRETITHLCGSLGTVLS